MADNAKWYYVENGERKGPVALDALKKLAVGGTVSETTLVWKEGMKDWEKASSVEGLFPAAPGKFPTISVQPKQKPKAAPVARPNEVASPAGSSELPKVVPAKSTPASKQGPVETAPVTPVVAAPTTFTPGATAPAPNDESVNIQTEGPAVAARRHATIRTDQLLSKLKLAGYPCLIFGFMLVLTGKGCDSLGNRYASRLMAISQMAEQKFAAGYTSKINSLQARIDLIRDSGTADPERETSLRKQISDLQSEQSKERRRLQTSTWSDMKINASMARANNQAWGFFREMVFVFGSMVLVTGLLVIGIMGDGSEKWVCLVMLAIITFSLYIGGIAWLSSITNSIPSSVF